VARHGGPRRLAVGEDTYLWSRAHAHERGDDGRAVPVYLLCREVVTIRRDGAPGRMDVVFRADADGVVPDGLLYAGAVGRKDGPMLNLNEPGVVRALLDEALARGWQPNVPGQSQIDGWTLFDTALARRIAATQS
jgi:hypothetical protein